MDDEYGFDDIDIEDFEETNNHLARIDNELAQIEEDEHKYDTKKKATDHIKKKGTNMPSDILDDFGNDLIEDDFGKIQKRKLSASPIRATKDQPLPPSKPDPHGKKKPTAKESEPSDAWDADDADLLDDLDMLQNKKKVQTPKKKAGIDLFNKNESKYVPESVDSLGNIKNSQNFEANGNNRPLNILTDSKVSGGGKKMGLEVLGRSQVRGEKKEDLFLDDWDAKGAGDVDKGRGKGAENSMDGKEKFEYDNNNEENGWKDFKDEPKKAKKAEKKVEKNEEFSDLGDWDFDNLPGGVKSEKSLVQIPESRQRSNSGTGGPLHMDSNWDKQALTDTKKNTSGGLLKMDSNWERQVPKNLHRKETNKDPNLRLDSDWDIAEKKRNKQRLDDLANVSEDLNDSNVNKSSFTKGPKGPFEKIRLNNNDYDGKLDKSRLSASKDLSNRPFGKVDASNMSYEKNHMSKDNSRANLNPFGGKNKLRSNILDAGSPGQNDDVYSGLNELDSKEDLGVLGEGKVQSEFDD